MMCYGLDKGLLVHKLVVIMKIHRDIVI